MQWVSDNLYTWFIFFIKLFHAIFIMINATFCFKCICCFLYLLKFLFKKSLTIQILLNNTNIVKSDSTYCIIKASLRGVVQVDFWCKFYHLSLSFIAFIEVLRTRKNSSFVNTRELSKFWVQIPGRLLFPSGLNVNYLSSGLLWIPKSIGTLCSNSSPARHR